MSQTRGMAYLCRKLELKRSRVLTRYKYYEMKNAVKDFGMVTPPCSDVTGIPRTAPVSKNAMRKSGGQTSSASTRTP